MSYKGIVVAPEAVNITLNEETVFMCKAITDHIIWMANNTPVDFISHKDFVRSTTLLPVNETERIYLSQLRLIGSHFSNATEIVCIAVLLTNMSAVSTATSDPVLLLVQGLSDHACN